LKSESESEVAETTLTTSATESYKTATSAGGSVAYRIAS